MAKLKAFVAQSGFFEVAVAAPSMKAAIEITGISPKAFKQGFAKETNEPSIVAAVMAKPGIELKRAKGSKDRFTENPALPKVSGKTLRDRAADIQVTKAEIARAKRATYRRQRSLVALAKAEKRHLAMAEKLNAELASLQARLQRENERWDAERAKLSKGI